MLVGRPTVFTNDSVAAWAALGGFLGPIVQIFLGDTGVLRLDVPLACQTFVSTSSYNFNLCSAIFYNRCLFPNLDPMRDAIGVADRAMEALFTVTWHVTTLPCKIRRALLII